DTETISRACYRLALEKFGVAADVDVDAHYAQLIGLPAPTQRQVLGELLGGVLPASIDVGEFDGYWRRVFRQQLAGGGEGVPAKAGGRELWAWVARQGVGLAVATSTKTDLARTLLGRAGLLAGEGIANQRVTGGGIASQRVVGGDQVARGKPSPDLYLRAASVVGATAGECLAFEDSAAGVASAAAAGMKVVCVPDVVAVGEDTREMAMMVAESLGEARERLGWGD
ncbi:MAG: HAD family phosphatase, partial [Proteobacteria bacterium]|nr:HAD family phosphatase [Pseudomonadota bacterium]